MAAGPGPVKAERRDRREQASRKGSLDGWPCRSTILVRGNGRFAPDGAIARRLRFAALCPSARFAPLPFALCVSLSDSVLIGVLDCFRALLSSRDLPFAANGELRSSRRAQSPELGGTSILVLKSSAGPIPLTLPLASLFSVRPLRPISHAALAASSRAWLCRSGS